MFTLFSALSTGLEVTAILLALNFIANSIRFIYGISHKIYCFIRFIAPFIVQAILATADFISWINSMIDWRLVGEIIIDSLKAIASAFYVAGEFCGKAFYRWQSDWVGTQCSFGLPEFESPDPAINPLFAINEQFQPVTVKNLRKMQSFPRSYRKQDMINALLSVY